MSSLHLSEDVVGDVCTVRVYGYLDFDMAPQLKRCLMGRIDGGQRIIVVDLTEVGFVDSTAIGVLVGVLKRLELENGFLAVVCDNDNVRGIFELVGLDNIIPLFASYDEAVAALPQLA